MLEQVRELAANGVSLSYVESGNAAQDLLLVHGGLSDLRIWEAQVAPFSEHFHVVAYSRRSHYPNPWKKYPVDYSVGTERDDLVALIHSLGLNPPVHLVGASYGGFACTLVARDFPDMVRSLILSEPPILALLLADPEGSPLYADFQRKVRTFVSGFYDKGEFEAGLRAYMLNVGGRDIDLMPESVRKIQLQNAATLMAEVTAAEKETFGPSDSAKVMAPTLLLSGEISVPYLRRTAQNLARILPRCEFVTVPKAGHAINSQNAMDYNGLVLDFLARLP